MAPDRRSIGITEDKPTHKMADALTYHSQVKHLTAQSRMESQESLTTKLDAVLQAFWAKLSARAANPKRDPQAQDQKQKAQNGRGSQGSIQKGPAPVSSDTRQQFRRRIEARRQEPSIPAPKLRPTGGAVARRPAPKRRIKWLQIPTHSRKETCLNPQSSVEKFPERTVLAGSATFGEKQRDNMKYKKKEKKLQKENITTAVCALLNSGGGLVRVQIENEDFDHRLDTLGLDIEKSLDELISNTTSKDYFDITQDGLYLNIFVKSWTTKKNVSRICSVDTSLYFRSFTSKKKASPMQVMEMMEKKSKGKRARFDQALFFTEQINELLDRQYFNLNEKLQLSESSYMELKDFSGASDKVRIQEVIPDYFSAFANSDGGCLIIGVDNDAKVKGCCSQRNESETKHLVEERIEKLKISHFDKCGDKRAPSYKLTITNVFDDQNKHSGFVIILKIEPFCCLIFADDPQSWIMNSDSFVSHIEDLEQLNPSDWIKMMSTKDTAPSLESQFQQVSLSDRPPLTKPVYIKSGHESLETVQRNLFGDIVKEITVKPEKLYTQLCNENPEVKDIIEKWLPKEKGLLILSRSWAVDIGLNSDPNVVFDALLIATNRHPKLYTVFKKEISYAELTYSRLTALRIKLKLVIDGGYTGKLCVLPKPLSLEKENNHPQVCMGKLSYPPEYKLDNVDAVEELLRSILIVLLRFQSVLSDHAGMEVFKLLTTDQYQLLSDTLLDTRHLFVHGLPGSGKTVVAVKIMEKIRNLFHCSKEDILYICENNPLRDYIRQLNICTPMTRTVFMKEEHFRVKHIIIDEAQSFRTADGDWYRKAKNIFKNAGETSIFWIFMDYFQANHPYKTGLPDLANQNKAYLTKIIRNAISIYNYMLDPMEKIASNKSFLKNLKSKCECSHPIQGVLNVEHNLDERQIIGYVVKTCSEYIHTGYSPGDIAILCDTEYNARDFKQKLRLAMRKLRLTLVDANSILKNQVIIDSVLRFSGLERPIVIAINPVPVQSEVMENILLCAASRASTQLHVLFKENKP
ncbi:schlafen family member 13-like [Pelobates fuscus]|uniref:schlafen family member 13-like n=1 Tax=Pelobates fuscus TaxID=191477 RepID=UPI002FE45DB3